MTILKIAWVTGAEGFIGSHMVDFLLEKEWIVIGSIKPGVEKSNINHITHNKNFVLLEIDMLDQKKIEDLIKKYTFDAIFHFASQSIVKPSWDDPKYTIEVNILGTIYIFEAIKKHKKETKVVLACSSAQYGIQSKNELPLKETNRLRPVHPYGISKVAQELLGIQYWINFKIPTIILRLFNQTGPRKNNDACSEFGIKIAQIELGKKKPEIKVGNLSTFRDILGIKDTIQAIWLAFLKGKPGEVYNVCSAKRIKIRDVLEYYISMSTKKIKVIENSPDLLRLIDEPIILGDNSKIKDELGFKPTQNIYSVLKDIFDYWIEYYQNNSD